MKWCKMKGPSSLIWLLCVIFLSGWESTAFPNSGLVVSKMNTQDRSSNNLPEGYGILPGDNVAYKIYYDKITWDKARDRCISDGGSLAITDTSDKIERIRTIVADIPFYIGIYRPAGSEHWIRVETGVLDYECGTSCKYASTTQVSNINCTNPLGERMTSLPWKLGIPDNDGEELCAVISGPSTLLDIPCNWAEKSICEIRISNALSTEGWRSTTLQQITTKSTTTTTTTTTKPTPTTTTTMPTPTKKSTTTAEPIITGTDQNLTNSKYPGYTEYSHFRTAYKIYEEYSTYSEARNRCFSDGGRLAVVNSFEKVNALAATLKTDLTHVGIRTSSANFVEWVIDSNGEPLKDLPWSQDNLHTITCVALRNDGSGLQDTICSNRLQFLCEIPEHDSE